MKCMDVDDAVQLIRLEYLEMPGLALTQDQVRRLWSFPADLCQRALDRLLSARFLTRTVEGIYVRMTDGAR